MNEYPAWLAGVGPHVLVNMAFMIGFYHWGYHKGKRSRDEK